MKQLCGSVLFCFVCERKVVESVLKNVWIQFFLPEDDIFILDDCSLNKQGGSKMKLGGCVLSSWKEASGLWAKMWLEMNLKKTPIAGSLLMTGSFPQDCRNPPQCWSCWDAPVWGWQREGLSGNCRPAPGRAFLVHFLPTLHAGILMSRFGMRLISLCP